MGMMKLTIFQQIVKKRAKFSTELKDEIIIRHSRIALIGRAMRNYSLYFENSILDHLENHSGKATAKHFKI